MKIAVIGATGFIGHRLCEMCIARGDTVHALARAPKSGESLAERGVSVIYGNLTNEESLCRVCSGADIVFNLAGALGKWRKSLEEMEIVNSTAAGLVVHWAAKAGASKVVHASTAGVSGPLPDGYVGCETDEPNPASDYQKTKLAGESTALDKHRLTGIPLTIARPSFVYGPTDTHKLSLFRTVAARRMVLVNGGTSRLHPVFVDDLIRGLLLIGERAPGNGEVYILAGERPAATRDLVRTIASSLSVSPPKISLPEGLLLSLAGIAEVVGRVAGKEPPLTCSKVRLLSENYAYSIDKAKSELGFTPEIGLSEGITQTIEWYRANRLIG
ncbi:MAG TPA: NAD-dependent epimerase/dehydratase family protein [Armatimonadota bacterium]